MIPSAAYTEDAPHFIYHPVDEVVFYVPVSRATPGPTEGLRAVVRRDDGRLLVNIYVRTGSERVLGCYEFEYGGTAWR